MKKWFGETQEDRSKRIQIFVIYFTVFVDVLGYGLVISLLPFLAMKFGANGLLLGVVFSSYSLCSFTASMVLGRLSDRYGRKPIILLSLFGSMIGPLLLFLSNSVFWLVLSRSIAGFCGGSVPVAQAYVSDITSKEERMQFMGWLGSFTSLGIVAGPALGGLLSDFGLQIPVLAASIIAGFNLVIGWFVLKETNKRAPSPTTDLKTAPSSTMFQKMMDTFRIVASKEYLFFFTSAFFATCGISVIEVSVPFAMQDKFGATARTLGLMWTVYGIGLVVIKTFLVPPAKKYLGERKTAMAAQVGTAVCIVLLALAPNLYLAFVSFGFHATFQGLFSPSLPALLSTRSPDNLRGLLLGSYSSFGQLARIFVPVLSGLLLNVDLRFPFFAAGCTHLAALASTYLIPETVPYQVLPAIEESTEMNEVVTTPQTTHECIQEENEETVQLVNKEEQQ